MKTTNLVKIASVILLGIALNGTAKAEGEKYSRNALPSLTKLTHAIILPGEFTRNIQMPFAQPVEDWMFERNYLSEEKESIVESWMLESNYLEEEDQPLESWMFNADRAVENESFDSPEPWMFDANYLSR